MTESVSQPRSRSRSHRSSARSRSRSVAAAADTAASASARPGHAPAGDAQRDERTLDLFGDPVFEPDARAAGVAHDDTLADMQAAAAVADSEQAARQATLDGFDAPAATVVPDGGVAMSAEAGPAAGHRDVRDANVMRASDADATKAADVEQPGGIGATALGEPVAGGAQPKAGGVPEAADDAGTDAALAAASAIAVAGAPGAVIGDRSVKPGSDVAGPGAPGKRDEAARTPGGAAKARRASSGGKRRAANGAHDMAAGRGEPQADAVGANAEPASISASSTTEQPVRFDEPQASVEQAKPVPPTVAATAGDAARAAVPASPAVQPVASAASFVTKPSADRPQPASPSASAFDPDTHLRPLSDRLAALQADMAGVKHAADREMRRVNRLLLALAVVVFAGLAALVLQTRQIAHLKQELDVRQQRIDRLAADLSTQQATLMTLADHHDALLSQVDRLQRNANREAAVAKRARRTR
ncbi:flagellar hook-length control protein FliK [Burkholderia latens]|uniref:flagellar hook-length control protein FliK n=1 Tax=Burkholderia latens TaxID=488446 RepID=UPI00158AF9B0|nr:flagellar hook-length control protein FliK [Burkholderia latens]